MITTNIYGGLGNQMFQYACGKSLSIKNNTELGIEKTLFKNYELRDFLLDKFNTKYKAPNYSKLQRNLISNYYIRAVLFYLNKFKIFQFGLFFEKEDFKYNKKIESPNIKFIYGYWQSVDYFENIRKELLKDFTLKERLDTINKELMEEIRSSNSISLHVRRGDYLKMKDSENGHGLCSLEYYDNAIKYISKEVLNPHFYVFSDDIDWVKNSLKIPFPVTFINNNYKNPEKDLILMKNCKHNITANSSFSWWGSWLNENLNKIVVMPSKWMNNLEIPKGLIYENCKII